MNTETQKVDVLATLEALESGIPDIDLADYREARAAVAELIEAVKLGGDMPKKDGTGHAGMFFTADNAARLRAALARVGGAA